jgi:hypothetical protein
MEPAGRKAPSERGLEGADQGPAAFARVASSRLERAQALASSRIWPAGAGEMLEGHGHLSLKLTVEIVERVIRPN